MNKIVFAPFFLAALIAIVALFRQFTSTEDSIKTPDQASHNEFRPPRSAELNLPDAPVRPGPAVSVIEPTAPATAPASVSTAHSPGRRLLEPVTEDMLDRSILEKLQNDESIKRFRVVKIDTDYLRDLIRNPDDSPLVIELFPDVTFTAVPSDRQEWHTGAKSGLAVWVGTQVDQPQSNVFFTIRPSGQVESIAIIGAGRYRLVQTDQAPYHVIAEITDGWGHIE